jgi:uncharacterized protein DUF6885
LALLDQVRWFSGARELVFLPRNEIAVPGRLRGIPISREWTVEGLLALLGEWHERCWVAPVATVDVAGLGADDTPERALVDHLDGGLPPMWSSRQEGTRALLIAGTVTGPGGTVLPVMAGDGRVRFQTIERMAGALWEILLVVPT